MDDTITQFIAITDALPEKARQYLSISENNLEQAIELFFNTDGAELYENVPPDTAVRSTQPPPVPPPETQPGRAREDVIDLDSDDEMEGTAGAAAQAARPTPPGTTHASAGESDEAMARRLQEEIYGEAGLAGSGATAPAGDVDAEGYRAPIARTRETLVGPDPYGSTEDAMQAAVMEQLARRDQMRARTRGSRPGIFNQQDSIWNEEGGASGPAGEDRQERLARATGGASTATSKSTLLAEMYRPPFDIMTKLSWDDIRADGKEGQKWIMVNVQDPSIFDCQVLNRDLWKHEGIRETIRENFIFMQCNAGDPRGEQYMQYYFLNHDDAEAYPHIAIVDPRTGEQVKVWSGPPAPKASEFLMQLHEFLDRYSLSVTARNPVAKRKPEQRKGVASMTEEEQLEMAMQASLAGQGGRTAEDNPDDDPDALTRSMGDVSKEQASIDATANAPTTSAPSASNGISGQLAPPPACSEPEAPAARPSPFDAISDSSPHAEPAATEPNTTRVQFRHPTGRVVRRFALADPVRRLYEWLKAEPLEGKQGVPFELVAMGKNLIGELETTVEEAGLRNGTVMVEFVQGTEGGD